MQATIPLAVLVCFSSPGAAGAAPPSNTVSIETIRQTAATTARRSSAIDWVRVHPPGGSPCPSYSAGGFDPDQSVEHVWCFEGAAGDSTWPVRPGEHWDHWSRFDPPGGNLTRWHVTSRFGGAATGSYNAWVGCDSIGSSPGCTDTGSWIYPEGYGDDWDYPLVLDCSGQNATSGGTIEFDLRFDVELLYDYVYLEYLRNAVGWWEIVVDSAGTPAIFHGTSGGGGYGSSTWLTDLQFELPAQPGDTKLRWRAASDGAWSDADGSADTDGMGAIDNLTVTFASDGAVVSDDFESSGFGGVSATIGSASWAPGGLIGSDYDGWHFEYEPQYQRQDGFCDFVDDWMWSAKEGAIPPEGNGFDFLLVSPAIDVQGWTGGLVEFDSYFTSNDGLRQDWKQELYRTRSASGEWSAWDDFDPLVIWGDPYWERDKTIELTPYLGPAVDSIQVAWELLDTSEPGSNTWGKHGGVKYYVDNVAFGSFDGTVTVFWQRSIDGFADTFSRSDPAHSPFLSNEEQGRWDGISLPGYDRALEDDDSLAVHVTDPDGITEGNVVLWWRRDGGAWSSKPMDLSLRDHLSSSDEGYYRVVVGKDDGGAEDMTPAGDGLIWDAGTTVDYYVEVTDDGSNVCAFPETAPGEPFTFRVLPFYESGPAQAGETYLLVEDSAGESVDFESSSGFVPGGGAGGGTLTDPVFADSEVLIRAALDGLGLVYDRYVVRGAGSSVFTEPRGTADPVRGLGGILDENGLPNYDCIVWSLGRGFFDTISDSSRAALETYLDAGGRLFVCGDDAAFSLADIGVDPDPEFLRDYLGTSLTEFDDRGTEVRILNTRGVTGTSLDGAVLGIYGECPVRRAFDRLTLATPVGATNEVLMTYSDGGPSDEGRASVIRNGRTVGGGVAALAAFDLAALASGAARECLLEKVLEAEFGLTVPLTPECPVQIAVDAPLPESLGRSLRAHPNPFRGRTSIRFQIPREQHVEIAVFDVSGRRVRSLVRGVLPASTYAESWDGLDDRGQRVAGGIYFVRMEAGELRTTRKTVLVR